MELCKGGKRHDATTAVAMAIKMKLLLLKCLRNDYDDRDGLKTPLLSG